MRRLAPSGQKEVMPMPLFMVRNTHRAEECDLLDQEWKEQAPEQLKGSLRLFCTCSTGDHGAFFEIEAGTAERALALLPPRFRAGSRIHAGEALTI
jgi:hypothetical protein